MLTTQPRTTIRVALRALLMTFVVATSLVAVTTPATAATCVPPNGTFNPSTGQYTCTVPGTPGEPGDPGDTGGGSDGGEPAEPTCDLGGRTSVDSYENTSAPFCIGTDVCFNADLFAPLELPAGEKPNEDSEARVTMCYDGIMGPPAPNEVFWTGDEPEPPSLAEQALTAIGQIDLGTPDVGISPQNRTLVNLDTWFWVDGVQAEAQGSSAFGLVATALDPTLTVDPGDGSGTMTCPLVTSSREAEESCAHVYRRASTRGAASVGGRPAYDVDVQVVYRLEFRVNGTLIDEIPGAPPTLSAGGDATPLRVDEIQSRVTGLR